MEQVDSIINGPHAYLMEDLTVLPAFPRLAHFLMTYFQTYTQCETILRTLRSKKKKKKKSEHNHRRKPHTYAQHCEFVKRCDASNVIFQKQHCNTVNSLWSYHLIHNQCDNASHTNIMWGKEEGKKRKLTDWHSQ